MHLDCSIDRVDNTLIINFDITRKATIDEKVRKTVSNQVLSPVAVSVNAAVAWLQNVIDDAEKDNYRARTKARRVRSP